MTLPDCPKSVLLVDDDPEMHVGMRIILPAAYALTCAASGEEGIEINRNGHYPVVILDLNMRGLDGVETLRVLRESDEFQKVIILTGFDSKNSAISCVNLGAFRYLVKPFRVVELVKVVELAFDRYAREVAAFSQFIDSPERLAGLGLRERESEVVFWAALGESNLEIADRLGISPRTVEKHLERAFNVLGVGSRAKLGGCLRKLIGRASPPGRLHGGDGT
ncbi:MAG: response regulator transcription factor [Terrimicrobiaceae bacterium]|nr:response regulator transcription factor [Terrimicrobiaceae bacterium]